MYLPILFHCNRSRLSSCPLLLSISVRGTCLVHSTWCACASSMLSCRMAMFFNKKIIAPWTPPQNGGSQSCCRARIVIWFGPTVAGRSGPTGWLSIDSLQQQKVALNSCPPISTDPATPVKPVTPPQSFSLSIYLSSAYGLRLKYVQRFNWT